MDSHMDTRMDPHFDILQDVLRILDHTLGLQGRSVSFHLRTPLLGAVPELDSMAVVALVAALEEHFSMTLDDEDLDAAMFSTVGSLCAVVDRKLPV